MLAAIYTPYDLLTCRMCARRLQELKRQASKNLGLPNANKIDQEELSKLKDIVKVRTALRA